jgi:small GTP-binding protein
MSRTYTLVVTGPFSAGKTYFIKTISEIAVVSTERKITNRVPGQKAQTTVAMDYGRMEQDGHTVHLKGTPGQARFDFMWDVLTKEMDGFIVLVDATTPDSFEEARELIQAFTDAHDVPYVVAANKQDLESALTPDKLRKALHLPATVLIMPCVASRKTSVKQVISQLIKLIGE